MKKFKFVLITLLLVTLPAFSNAITLKVATISPDGSSWMKSMRSGAKEIEKQTSGRVKIKFYTGGVMGNDRAVLKKIRFRQLQGGALTSNSLSHIYKDSQLYTLPMLFRGQGEVDFVRQQLDPKLLQGYRDSGYEVFGFAGGGFAYVMSKSPIHSIEDIRKNKVWIPSNDNSAKETVEAFGISPIPLSLGDVLPSLQTGIIDTIATSPIGAIALQWHTQVKYVVDLPILYVYAYMAIEQKAFNKLSKEDQLVFRQVMTDIFAKIDQHNREENEQALMALKQFGVQFKSLDRSQKEEWERIANHVGPNLVTQGRLTDSLFSELQSLIGSYRNQISEENENNIAPAQANSSN